MFITDVIHHIKCSDDPLGWTFLSGGAGVGKTMTIDLLYQYIVKTLKTKTGIDKDQLFVLKVAPSGTAAYLLKGNTIHSALRILPSRQLS